MDIALSNIMISLLCRTPVPFDNNLTNGFPLRADTSMNWPLARRGLIAICCLLSGLAPAKAGPHDWPVRPVTMVIPLAAGSGLDVLGRVLSPRLSELLGQPVLVENIGGAGGMTGAVRVGKAPPDGYQFLLGTVGTHAQNQTLYKNPLYNAATDFSPVALIAEAPIVLIARKDLPASNLQEFMSYTRAN
jgi:tripartite-type tricarboxylate transporter receptor subunit TctC